MTEIEIKEKFKVDDSHSKIRGVVSAYNESGELLFQKENMIVRTGRRYIMENGFIPALSNIYAVLGNSMDISTDDMDRLADICKDPTQDNPTLYVEIRQEVGQSATTSEVLDNTKLKETTYTYSRTSLFEQVSGESLSELTDGDNISGSGFYTFDSENDNYISSSTYDSSETYYILQSTFGQAGKAAYYEKSISSAEEYINTTDNAPDPNKKYFFKIEQNTYLNTNSIQYSPRPELDKLDVYFVIVFADNDTVLDTSCLSLWIKNDNNFIKTTRDGEPNPSLIAGKEYYTKNGNTYESVSNPTLDNIENYYEKSDILFSRVVFPTFYKSLQEKILFRYHIYF